MAPLAGLLCASVGVAVVAIGVVLLTGEDGQATRVFKRSPGGDLRVERHFPLAPVLRRQTGGTSIATAFIVRSGANSRPAIVIRARLGPHPGKAAYEAWLYRSIRRAHALGQLHPTHGGLLQGEAPLPSSYSERWRYLGIFRKRARAKRNRRHGRRLPGRSVLRGKLRTP